MIFVRHKKVQQPDDVVSSKAKLVVVAIVTPTKAGLLGWSVLGAIT
jgi:hypothetical protein